MAERIPVYDNHIHMSPSGRNIDAVKEFESAGGTGFTLVTLPYEEIPVSNSDDILRSFNVTLSMADMVREKTALEVNVAVGPYPVLLIPLAKHFGIAEAEKIMMQGMEEAAKIVASGKANAIGEIGKPHFDVPEEIMNASDRILMRGMELAAEIDCPVMIHSASSPELMLEFSEMAKTASLAPEMVIKHFSRPLVREDENHGIMPSIPASRSAIREALSKGDRFMLETDHIDDPRRPDMVLPVNTVPKRVLGLMSSGEISTETAWKIGRDIPDRLYKR